MIEPVEPFEEFCSNSDTTMNKDSAEESLPENSQEAMLQALIAKALEQKEHSTFEFIKNYSEFRAVKICQDSLKKVVKMFDRVAKAIQKEYCTSVIAGTNDFNLLFAYKQYLEVKHYYEQELIIANDMLDEYDNYTWSGHLIDQYLLFKTRPDTDLVDTRKKKHGTK
jgi:hypothetical protein